MLSEPSSTIAHVIQWSVAPIILLTGIAGLVHFLREISLATSRLRIGAP